MTKNDPFWIAERGTWCLRCYSNSRELEPALPKDYCKYHRGFINQANEATRRKHERPVPSTD